jgi:fructose-specific phosphotransferase system IIC component
MKENKIPVSQEIKKHLLTGISWMIPLIVAAGICMAVQMLVKKQEQSRGCLIRLAAGEWG